jgi:hypothetical protein
MNSGVFIWLLIFAVSAAVFFLIAGVVTVKGLRDLRILLRLSKRNDDKRM